MKKLLVLTLSIASIGLITPSAEAKTTEPVSSITTTTNAVEPQWRTQDRWGRRGVRRGARVTTQSRIVRVGRRTYREVYQVRYLPNGRVTTRLISRTRIR